MGNQFHDFRMNFFYAADLVVGDAVDTVPLLMLGDGGGVFIGLLQILLVGFVDILGQALFERVALLAQPQAVGRRHI